MPNIGMVGMRPLKGKGDEYSDSVRAKLKGSASEKRKFASQIRGLQWIKNPTKREARLKELLQNPEKLGLEILNIYQDVLESDVTNKEKIELMRTLTQFFTAFHGQKLKNLNLNVGLETGEVAKEIIKILNENY